MMEVPFKRLYKTIKYINNFTLPTWKRKSYLLCVEMTTLRFNIVNHWTHSLWELKWTHLIVLTLASLIQAKWLATRPFLEEWLIFMIRFSVSSVSIFLWMPFNLTPQGFLHFKVFHLTWMSCFLAVSLVTRSSSCYFQSQTAEQLSVPSQLS